MEGSTAASKLRRRLLGFDILAVAVAYALFPLTGKNHFGEGRFITFLSVLQLLGIAWIAFRLYRVRSVGRAGPAWRHPSMVWGLIAFGFVFLAADELLKIHENLDELIHEVLAMEETAWTDRIDDLIVGSYGLIGLAVLFFCREELLAHRVAIPWLAWGFVLMFLMVGLDSLTNRKDALTHLVGAEDAEAWQDWLGMTEDAFKVFAEAFFVFGFHAAWLQARRSGGVTDAAD